MNMTIVCVFFMCMSLTLIAIHPLVKNYIASAKIGNAAEPINIVYTFNLKIISLDQDFLIFLIFIGIIKLVK